MNAARFVQAPEKFPELMFARICCSFASRLPPGGGVGRLLTSVVRFVVCCAALSTVTMKLPPVAGRPAALTAPHTTVVVPTAKTDPDGGTQLTVGLGSTSSVAVATYETIAPAG